MRIVSLCASSRRISSNAKLLAAIAEKYIDLNISPFNALDQLPLFRPEDDRHPYPDSVLAFKTVLSQADGIIISTPEYIHNIPALLKNAFEWVTTSGELHGKPVLALTYTPAAPRGEKAMQSLLWSLGALEARVLASLPLYRNELDVNDGYEMHGTAEILDLVDEAMRMLKNACQ